jgi:hypothetical protein
VSFFYVVLDKKQTQRKGNSVEILIGRCLFLNDGWHGNVYGNLAYTKAQQTLITFTCTGTM